MTGDHCTRGSVVTVHAGVSYVEGCTLPCRRPTNGLTMGSLVKLVDLSATSFAGG